MLKKVMFVVLVVCMSSNLYAEEKKSSSLMMNIDCLNELSPAKLRNDKNYNDCTKSVIKQSRIKYMFSSKCQKEFETKKRMTTDICKQEQANIAVAAGMELHNCAQISQPISSKCSEQLKSDLESTKETAKRCTDAVNKISTICGDDIEINMQCYQKHTAEVVAVCGEKKFLPLQ